MSNVLVKMMEYFGKDVARINHALKVDGYARAIAESEGLNGDSLYILHLACALHDIGIPEALKKHGSIAGKYQEAEGPVVARPILESLNADPAAIDRVCYLIGHHHSYDCIDGLDFQILVEADFFVNIDEGNMEYEAVKSVHDKIFKTKTGLRLLETLYI